MHMIDRGATSMNKLQSFKSGLIMIYLIVFLCLESGALRGVDILDAVSPISEVSMMYMSPDSYVTENKQSKILDPLQKIMNQNNVDSKSSLIEVSVMLRYDLHTSKEHFIEQYADLLQDSVTDINGFGVNSFFAKLSIEQIYKVAELEQISSLSTIDDVLTVL